MEDIEWQGFIQVELRVGRIITSELFPEARKLAHKPLIDSFVVALANLLTRMP
jgi:tRNA-binding protein